MGAARSIVLRRRWSAPIPIALALIVVAPGLFGSVGVGAAAPFNAGVGGATSDPTSGSAANFTAAIGRLVELVGLAGSGLLALVWARVALSWFSNDVTKKIQAKDRARDALIGTLLFVAAVSGLVWALAHWVVTGA